MNFVTNIDKDKYENFVKNHPTKSHFLQSYAWGEFVKENKNMIPHYVGLTDENNNLVSTALLLQKKLPLGLSYFYSPRGFVIDFFNKDLLLEFTKYIKEYIKKYKAIFLKIDPDVKLHDLDIDGNIIKNNNDNMELVKYLKKIGYKHKGFNKNFENNEPRYTFRLGLRDDIDTIFDNFHPTTKKIAKRGNPYNLIVIKNDENLINDFYITMKKTAERENISIYSIDYYSNFYKELHKNNMSDLYSVQVNINYLKELYKDNIDNLNNQIKSIKSETKKQEYINQLNRVLKEKEELDSIEDEYITLSSIITAKYNDKVWTIHGGNHHLLRSLNANYLIYFEIIKDAKKENYKTIDFFGTTGKPDKNNPVYGIHLFKKRLGGEYTEFIGEFDYVTKRFLYFVFNKLIVIRRYLVKKKNKH